MSKRLAILILVALSAFFCVLYSGERVFLWLLLLAGFVFVLALLNVAYTLLSVRISQSVSPGELTGGEYGTLVIGIHNRGAFPLAHIGLWHDTYETLFSGGLGDKEALKHAVFAYSTGVMPRKTESFRKKIFFPYRGRYAPGIVQADLVDIFGLCRFRLPRSFYTDVEPVFVLPKPLALSLEGIDDSPVAGDAYGAYGDREPYSVAEIREFRLGDPLKWVHWKLTARTGVLQVKEFDVVHAPLVMAFLDLSPHGLEGEQGAALEDCMCRHAAAVCESALSAFTPVRLIAYGEERLGLTGFSPQEMVLFRRLLAGLDFRSPFPFRDIIRMELEENPETSQIVIVTAELTPALSEYLVSLSAQGHSPACIVASKDFAAGDAAGVAAGVAAGDAADYNVGDASGDMPTYATGHAASDAATDGVSVASPGLRIVAVRPQLFREQTAFGGAQPLGRLDAPGARQSPGAPQSSGIQPSPSKGRGAASNVS
jgi:uncharacterized protein (DUF58 family)